MVTSNNSLKSTIIISVYTDHVALELILDSLKKQTCKNFEIIISEDGRCDDIKRCVNDFTDHTFNIQHLSQEDNGFRKNVALNKAVLAAGTDHLIFIDGDCIPHPSFIAAHQHFAQAGTASTGRRLELGENISRKLRTKEISFYRFSNRLLYLLYIIPLLMDKAKNVESGLYSRRLHKLTQDKEIRLLGCNFSCNKQDLLKINGFNEDYLAAGIGEDSDIDWRLIHTGVTIKNIKFTAIQYHLHHPRFYNPSKENEAIFNRTKDLNLLICEKGLRK